MKIQLRRENAPAPDSEIKHLEQEIGAAVPPDFAEFLSKRNGCQVETNVFRIDDGNDSGVNAFLSIERILAEKSALDERISRTAWPIADAEGGNYVCLRRERPGGWSVVFWDHELDQETILAQSFTEFLEGLEKFDPASVELKPGQVISAWIDPALLTQSEEH